MILPQYRETTGYQLERGVTGEAAAVSDSHDYRGHGCLAKLGRGWAGEDLTFS
jgi:hypothetical protein